MIIDFHSHVFPRLSADEWTRYAAVDKFVRECRTTIEQARLEPLVEDMSKAGVDKAVILPVCGSHDFSILMNDFIAKIVESYPEHFIGFACAQPKAGEAALQELERAVKDLRLSGLKIMPNYLETRIDSTEMKVIIEKAVQLRIPILIHCDNLLCPYLDFSHPGQLIYGRILTKHFPTAKIIATHMGGGLPLFKGWTIPEFDAALERLYYDTSPEFPVSMLETAIRSVGDEHILMGSDYPLRFPSLAVKRIRELSLPEDTRERILGENAAQLLGLKSS